jgi:hypothetical protein
MQTASETFIGWKSGRTTCVPLWDRTVGAWLWTLLLLKLRQLGTQVAHMKGVLHWLVRWARRATTLQDIFVLP